MVEYILLSIYGLCIAMLFIYGVNCYYIVWRFWKTRRCAVAHLRQQIESIQAISPDNASLPYVTTQIPLYNEANVAERVIQAVVDIDYPPAKHEIQILDDSTDQTSAIVDAVVMALRQSGKDIQVFRRDNRQGFKAGALAAGLMVCKGEFVAIFDSDFVPNKNFLREIIPVLLEIGRASCRERV